jgi:hypothetical protein
LIPVSAILYIVIKVIWLRPEAPVVHMFNIVHWQPALFSLIAALAALFLTRIRSHK